MSDEYFLKSVRNSNFQFFSPKQRVKIISLPQFLGSSHFGLFILPYLVWISVRLYL